MIYQINIWGLASGKIYQTIEVTREDLDNNLMNFLLSKSIPVASSCSGNGVCKKCMCIIDELEILTCQKTLFHLFSKSNNINIYFKHL